MGDGVSEFGEVRRATQVAGLARSAADWLVAGNDADPGDLSLYHGLAGVILALREAHQYFGDDRYQSAVERGADALSAQLDGIDSCSLYFGLAGAAVALHALCQDAARPLSLIRDRFDGQRWNEMFELFAGNAGIGLGALRAGDLDLAVTAVTPYLTTASQTLMVSTGPCARPRRDRTTSRTARSASCTRLLRSVRLVIRVTFDG